MLDIFISNDAKVDETNKNGESALTIAVRRNHFNIVKVLLVDHRASTKGETKLGLKPIDYAILPGFYNIAKLIFDNMSQ